MKVMEILPELKIGGVERHVIDLSNELAARGNDVLVVSAGGKMSSQLSPMVAQRLLPVHKKNPFTVCVCARKIARIAIEEKYQILHAHSRVPAWAAYLASSKAKVPFIVTAHGIFGNRQPWVYTPYRKAYRTICISETVRTVMKDCFYDNTEVIRNGLPEPGVKWSGPAGGAVKFLFVGRLSKLKGLQDVLKALPVQKTWTLDVIGDGPARGELEAIAAGRGLSDQVKFHGYSDSPDEFMTGASCLLFPSRTEGMGLVLARAVQIGLPVIASDIPAVAELAGGREGLLPPGDIEAWSKGIEDFIRTRKPPVAIPLSSVPSLSEMADGDERVYREAIQSAPVYKEFLN